VLLGFTPHSVRPRAQRAEPPVVTSDANHSVDPTECRPMAGPERYDALTLMRAFRADEARLSDALNLFVEREDYGFVWLAYREDTALGCCSVGYTVSTAAGGLTAVVRDLYVIPAARRGGIATAMLAALAARLAALDVARTEIAANGDAGLLAFVAARGLTVTAAIFAPGR
jgi:GNAT superfamily N-acetyltransferase